MLMNKDKMINDSNQSRADCILHSVNISRAETTVSFYNISVNTLNIILSMRSSSVAANIS